ncbi:uncharacterized protein [Amphiura filiformis]|uniref:uncharacterized protein n=1 Tax=Amphiura filiformis TaxID=82378 RepID=UPI003B215ADA
MASSFLWRLRDCLKISIFLTCLKISATQQCDSPMPLGMASGDILDNQITASSFFRAPQLQTPPEDGRLNYNNGYWSTANPNPSNPWINVDLQSSFIVTGINTQGNIPGVVEYVTQLDVQYGESLCAAVYVMENGVKKTFPANSDESSVVEITFPTPVVTRFIKVLPQQWVEWCSLRLEIIGCPMTELTTDGIATDVPPAECGSPVPLGMKDLTINDNQITASDFYQQGPTRFLPEHGRLDYYGYWCTKVSNPTNPCFMVDLLSSFIITGIQTQGNIPGVVEYITELDVKYGDSLDALAYVMENGVKKTFPANSDDSTVVDITFPTPVFARYIEILPQSWVEWCSLRLEIIGCPMSELTTRGMLTTQEDQTLGALTAVPTSIIDTPPTQLAPTTSSQTEASVSTPGADIPSSLISGVTQSITTTKPPASAVTETSKPTASNPSLGTMPSPGSSSAPVTGGVDPALTITPVTILSAAITTKDTSGIDADASCEETDTTVSPESTSFKEYAQMLKCHPPSAGNDDAGKQAINVLLEKFNEGIPSKINGTNIEPTLQEVANIIDTIIASLSLSEPFVTSYSALSVTAKRIASDEDYTYQPSADQYIEAMSNFPGDANSNVVLFGLSYKDLATLKSNETVSLGSQLSYVASGLTSVSISVDGSKVSVPVSFKTLIIEPVSKLKEGESFEPVCVYWDETNSSWSDYGCQRVANDEKSHATCSCNHTTNYAVLMQIKPGPPSNANRANAKTLGVLTTIGCSLSIFALISGLLIFSLFRNPILSQDRNLVHFHLMIAMLAAIMMFLLSNNLQENAVRMFPLNYRQ